MSVAVCRGPAVPAFEAPSWMRPAELYKPEALADDRSAQVDIWNAIQADVAVDNNKASDGAKKASKPYVVNPRVRRSSSSCLMSQKSLEICTESLGCETGSGDFTDMSCLFAPPPPTATVEAEESFWQQPSAAQENYSDESFCAMNYHRPTGTRSRSPRRSFPPPLPSMSSRDGPCLKMCSRRQDGRLVVEAVVVRPRGYLEASRQGGRLRLSFIECSVRGQSAAASGKSTSIEASYFPVVEDKSSCEQEEEEVAMEVEEEDEDEEEVEVVDRGTMVEVKVSSQPQAPAAAKVHRSTLVINKFVGSTPLIAFDQPRCHADAPLSELCARDETTQTTQASPSILRRVPSSTTTLAAAVAVASTETGAPPTPGDDDDEDSEDECVPSPMAAADTKQQLLLFTSRRGDKHDLLQSVRRCRQLRQKPLFILEPYCIATS